MWSDCILSDLIDYDFVCVCVRVHRGFELFNASIIKNVRFYQQNEKKSIQQLKSS